MKTILNTLICVVFFTLGWNIGVTFDNGSDDFTNCYVLWGILLLLILWRLKIKDIIEL